MAMGIREENWKPNGYTSLDDCSASKGLEDGTGGAIPSNSRMAIIQAIGADVRWRDDGTVPTVDDPNGGMLLAAGDSFMYLGDLTTIEFIEADAGVTADVSVSFYK